MQLLGKNIGKWKKNPHRLPMYGRFTYVYIGLSPLPVTVTTRTIITFLVGNPELNLHLPQASWEGEQPNVCIHMYIWVFPKIGVPQNRWFIMKNLIKMDDLGGTPIFGNTHIYPLKSTLHVTSIYHSYVRIRHGFVNPQNRSRENWDRKGKTGIAYKQMNV